MANVYKTLLWIQSDGVIEHLSTRGETEGRVIEMFGRNDKAVEVEVTYKKVSQKHSTAAQGYYRAVVLKEITEVIKASCSSGAVTKDDLDAVHEYLKKRFLDREDESGLVIDGMVYQKPMTLAGRSVDDMRIFIDRCIVYAADELSTSITKATGRYWQALYQHHNK